jgi:hypothetical protein
MLARYSAISANLNYDIGAVVALWADKFSALGPRAGQRAKKLELFDGRALDSETAADEREPELASESLEGEISWTRRRKQTLLR